MRHRMRKGTVFAAACCMLGIFVLAGCESIPEEHKGATVGAGAGAATGAVAGAVIGDTKGAVVGGLLGALVGGAIGHYAYDRQRDRDETAEAYNYTESQGTVLTLEDTRATPQTVSAGESVQLKATYAVLTPASGQTVEVQEVREITHNGKLVGKPAVTVSRAGGTYTSTIPLRLPADADTGTYEVTTTVKSARAQDTQRTEFRVQ